MMTAYDRIGGGIRREIDGEHDEIVAEGRRGEIVFGQHEHVDEVAEGIRGHRNPPAGEEIQKDEKDAVEHIPSELAVEGAEDKDFHRHGEHEQERRKRVWKYIRGPLPRSTALKTTMKYAHDHEKDEQDEADRLQNVPFRERLFQPFLHSDFRPALCRRSCARAFAADARRDRQRSLPKSSAISLAPPGVFSRPVRAMRTHQSTLPVL